MLLLLEHLESQHLRTKRFTVNPDLTKNDNINVFFPPDIDKTEISAFSTFPFYLFYYLELY